MGTEHAVAKDEAAPAGLNARRAARSRNVLVALLGECVAPRFDLATEVVIARARDGRLAGEPRVVILPGPSAEELCSLVLAERVDCVVCGGIEDVHYQYLTWKDVEVVDRVIGNWEGALRRLLSHELRPGTIVRDA